MTLSSYKQSTFKSAAATAPTPKPLIAHKQWDLRSKITIKRAAISLALLMLLAGGFVGGKFVYNTHKIFGGNILSVLSTTKLIGEKNGQVTILLAGNSADDYGHSGGDLTDSIMLLSIDTKNHKAYMMSIPRDLYVDVGNSDYSKINYVYVAGKQSKFDESGYPKGGMGQLESVLEKNLGIDINYYALVNYQALKQAVDAVGGVDFNVRSVDKRGLYDPNIDYTNNKPLVKLSNGAHHLNGQQALDLSRARGDSAYSYGFPRSDFDRTENQRKLLSALKDKAVSGGVLASPTRLSSLSDALGNNVKSDFTLGEVRRLYDVTKDISGNKITSVDLSSANGKNLLASYETPDGQSALIPAAGIDDYSDIKTYLRQITSSNPVIREAAQIVLLNGTSTIGLAAKQKTRLLQNNLHVIQLGDATNQPVTTIIDDSGGTKSGTVTYLKTLYPKATVTTISPYTKLYNADIIIVLGAEQVPASTTTSTSAH